MNQEDPSTGPTEPTGQPPSVQRRDPSMAGRPDWAVTELTRNPSSPHPVGQGRGLTGIEWVRPTDLVHRVSADLMTQGAGLHRDAHAWARTRLRETIPLSGRARRLPALSAFGSNGPMPARRDALGR